MNEWYTVNQVAKETEIPAETVRRYVRQYKNFLMVNRGERRSYLIHKTSIDAIKRIRYLLDHGHQQEQIKDILQQTETITIQSDDEQMKENMLSIPDLHKSMLKQIKKLTEQTEQQIQMIDDLTKRLDQQRENIKKRDEQLMNALNKIMEDNKKKKGFFSRLFR